MWESKLSIAHVMADNWVRVLTRSTAIMLNDNLTTLTTLTAHNATQRNATQRNATQRNATQRNATQRNATQHTHLHNHSPSIVLHQLAFPVNHQPESLLTTLQEVLRVTFNMEPDQITPQHPDKDLVIPGEQSEDVPRREGNVQEEGNLEPP